MTRITTAVVPVKTGPSAKLRLAHLLAWTERDALAQLLAAHVIAVLSGCGLDVVALTSPGTPAFDGASETWVEDAPGLNAALRPALRRLGGRALVVPSDLPWLERKDVFRMLEKEGDVVVAPTVDGGTGALLMRRAVEPAFGAHSSLAHVASARRAGAHGRVVVVPGFSRDLDDERSLVAARASSPAFGRTPPA